MAVADTVGRTVPGKNSDLRVRTLSAIVMVAVAGGALWLGGWVWAAFVTLVAAAVLWEWVKLSYGIAGSMAARVLWFIVGFAYIGLAAEMLWQLAFFDVLIIVLCVVATDIGAYFAGRTFGGPKIAPQISPSKTWAGLCGGMVAAGLTFWAALAWAGWEISLHDPDSVPLFHDVASVTKAVLVGFFIAIIAQSGDFFESWMKRRAGVKDAGNLIPGHGGIFDRVDGLLAVLFVFGVAKHLGMVL